MFKIGKLELEYFLNEHTKTNERCVEVSLGKFFLDKFSGQIVEVGNVLTQYYGTKHQVIDLYEKGANVINVDATIYHPLYEKANLLCLSTIEHFFKFPQAGIGDYWDSEGSNAVFDMMVKSAQNYLFTTPIGDNPTFEKYILEKEYKYTIMRRKNIENEWEIEPNKSNFDYVPYRNFPSAEALLIITNQEELL